MNEQYVIRTIIPLGEVFYAIVGGLRMELATDEEVNHYLGLSNAQNPKDVIYKEEGIPV